MKTLKTLALAGTLALAACTGYDEVHYGDFRGYNTIIDRSNDGLKRRVTIVHLTSGNALEQRDEILIGTDSSGNGIFENDEIRLNRETPETYRKAGYDLVKDRLLGKYANSDSLNAAYKEVVQIADSVRASDRELMKEKGKK